MPKRVIAILCSDLHLSHAPPVARSAESYWHDAMARGLRELSELQETDDGCVPIVVAGDVFEKWNSSPELINFALRELPEIYAIPGQHDLPHHGIGSIKKSAFWTLAEAKKIIPLGCEGIEGLGLRGLCLWGFPWSIELERLSNPNPDFLHLAIVHKYCWTGKNHYEGGDMLEHRVDNVARRLRGFDVALFGDNHKGFLWSEDDSLPTVFNAGTFFRRRIDEINYKPRVGLLHADGTVEEHFLDASLDEFVDMEDAIEAGELLLKADAFLKELKSMGKTGVDFREAVESFMEANDVEPEVRGLVKEAMEGD